MHEQVASVSVNQQPGHSGAVMPDTQTMLEVERCLTFIKLDSCADGIGLSELTGAEAQPLRGGSLEAKVTGEPALRSSACRVQRLDRKPPRHSKVFYLHDVLLALRTAAQAQGFSKPNVAGYHNA